MLSTVLAKTGLKIPNCDHCHQTAAAISMSGYSERSFDLCTGCALQLVRKITEDLCALLTKGGRHG